MTEWIPLIAAAVVLVGTWGVKALIDWRKSKVETDKTVRNGVLEEWREITAQQQIRLDALQKQLDEAEAKIVKLRRDYEDELRAMRGTYDKEMSALRTQIVAKETERIQDRSGEKHPGLNTQTDIMIGKVVEAIHADKAPVAQPPSESKQIITDAAKDITDEAKKL